MAKNISFTNFTDYQFLNQRRAKPVAAPLPSNVPAYLIRPRSIETGRFLPVNGVHSRVKILMKDGEWKIPKSRRPLL
jgi:hypothetical protein